RIASTMRRIGAWLFVIRRAVVVGRRTAVQLVEDALDAILSGDRIVVHEPEFWRAFEPQPRPDLPAQKCRGPAEGARARFARLFVAEHGIENPGDLQVGTDLDSSERDESDPGVVHFAGEQRGEL